jgi:hypothetical protein
MRELRTDELDAVNGGDSIPCQQFNSPTSIQIACPVGYLEIECFRISGQHNPARDLPYRLILGPNVAVASLLGRPPLTAANAEAALEG